MVCPKCRSQMETVVHEGIEVDRCVNCQGIWFDMIEHEKLKELRGSERIDIGSPEKGKKYNEVDRIECPICRSRMIRMVDRKQPHVWYESCAICHGAFFDAGEFIDFKDFDILDILWGLWAVERR